MLIEGTGHQHDVSCICQKGIIEQPWQCRRICERKWLFGYCIWIVRKGSPYSFSCENWSSCSLLILARNLVFSLEDKKFKNEVQCCLWQLKFMVQVTLTQVKPPPPVTGNISEILNSQSIAQYPCWIFKEHPTNVGRTFFFF